MFSTSKTILDNASIRVAFLTYIIKTRNNHTVEREPHHLADLLKCFIQRQYEDWVLDMAIIGKLLIVKPVSHPIFS